MLGDRTSPGGGELGEQQVESRLASIKVGIWLSVVVCLGSALYAVHEWHRPNRVLILAAIALGLLTAPLVRALPLERIVRSRHSELLFVAWSVADILLIATIAGLDGGSHSPYMLLLILPFLFAAMSYPPRTIAAVGIADLVAFFGVAFGVGGGLPLTGFGLFAGACIALLGAWEARNQSGQRAELTETAAARLLSEETSRRQAHQQREVARFGLLAIEGAHIDELAREASRILTGVLEIDFGGVLKLLPSEDELLLVAAEGLPKEMIGEARVPADLRSQSGYALAAGKSVVVEDWREETRFLQPDLQRSQGMQSAAIILIKGHGRPYGVIGAGSRVPHRFSQEDVSFMQAIANVLANAIDRRAAEQRTQHEALHDPLTGLPNRNLFLDRLEHALSVAQRRGTPVSVLFLDLDQFKLVNDSLGHACR